MCTIVKILLAVTIITFCSCGSTKKDELEQKVKQLENENRLLKGATNDQSSDNQTNANLSYVLMVLNITERTMKDRDEIDFSSSNPDFYKIINAYYVSHVKPVTDLSSEYKYRLLDEFQNAYISRPLTEMKKGRVIDRQIFYFSSYEEASRAREKYMMGR